MSLSKNSRPKISVFIAVSLDGFIAREDGDISWHNKMEIPGEDFGYDQFSQNVDTMIMGRKTYEKVFTMVSEWPWTGKRVIVLSSTLNSIRNEAELFNGDVTQLIQKLHSEGVKHIYVDGGVTVLRSAIFSRDRSGLFDVKQKNGGYYFPPLLNA